MRTIRQAVEDVKGEDDTEAAEGVEGMGGWEDMEDAKDTEDAEDVEVAAHAEDMEDAKDAKEADDTEVKEESVFAMPSTESQTNEFAKMRPLNLDLTTFSSTFWVFTYNPWIRQPD